MVIQAKPARPPSGKATKAATDYQTGNEPTTKGTKSMKTVHSFILKAYVGPMVLTFFVVMFILLMQFLWMHIDELVGKGLGPEVILELVMYAAATLIPMALPLATLLASIMTMGNLGENNELLALKAAGISLPRIMQPLVILMVVVSIASFFVINNLTPFSYQKMFTLMSDISSQKQEMKFQDGIFFNGIPDMSILVGHQDDKTNKLNDILIYSNSNQQDRDMNLDKDGDNELKMQTILADSGYIRISDDRKYLVVTLYNGNVYEQNRNYSAFNNNSTLSHHLFSKQFFLVPLSGFALERSDMESFSSRSETKNMTKLSESIDSLKHAQDSMVNAYEKRVITVDVFRNMHSLPSLDSIPYRSSLSLSGAVDTMDINTRNTIFNDAAQAAISAKHIIENESIYMSSTANQLYRNELDLQRKIALPFSIMIFFLIGAPLGAIIRKGGIGMPIVVSVAFFVVYYIISITAEKFVKDGAWPAWFGMWMSSMILFPIAIFLTYKSTNDSALFNPDAYKKRLMPIITISQSIWNTISKSFKK